MVCNETLRKQRAKKYNKDNAIQCEVCKKYFVQVGSHVKVHGYESAREYREEFGFDVKRGQVPEHYRKLKASHCKKNKTIDNLKAGAKYRFKKGQEGVGVYKRSSQTLNRLKQKNSNL